MKGYKHVPGDIDHWPNMKSDIKHGKVFLFQTSLCILDAEVFQEGCDADNPKMHDRGANCKVS
jgi:hypothetical protein